MLITPEMPPMMSRAPDTAESSFMVRAGLLLATPAHSFPVAHAALSFSMGAMCSSALPRSGVRVALETCKKQTHKEKRELSVGLWVRKETLHGVMFCKFSRTRARRR